MAVIITTILIAPAAAQDNEDAWRASIMEHAGDFDYLLGDWQFTSRGVYGEGGGYWTAVRPASLGRLRAERSHERIAVYFLEARAHM